MLEFCWFASWVQGRDVNRDVASVPNVEIKERYDFPCRAGGALFDTGFPTPAFQNIPESSKGTSGNIYIFSYSPSTLFLQRYRISRRESGFVSSKQHCASFALSAPASPSSAS